VVGEFIVLIGANGAGKSNFISLFKLLNKIMEKRLQEYTSQAGGADTFLYFGQKQTDEIRIALEFGPNGYICTLMPTVDDRLAFREEKCWSLGQYRATPYEISLGAGHEETRLEEKARSEPVAASVLEALQSWRVYHFHDTSESARAKKTGDIHDNSRLRPDAANLAAFLYLLSEKHRSHYDQIVMTTRLAAPFFQYFILKPLPNNPDKILLEWRERGHDNYLNVGFLSDGTLRFICLATLLLQPDSLKPSVIVIDEPELGLHPYAITLLASLLKSVAASRQVIVSTQSVPLVNQFTIDDVIVVDREDQQSTFKRLAKKDLTHWLDEYGLGDLWEKNLLGGRPQG
jgi:predicted ATPase